VNGPDPAAAGVTVTVAGAGSATAVPDTALLHLGVDQQQPGPAVTAGQPLDQVDG
jgi:uncharacterized protein YggE